MIIIDKPSLYRLRASIKKHIKKVEAIMEENVCATTGGKLADELNRFEKSVEVFNKKNNLE